MNYKFHTLKIFGSGSVLYYIFYSSPYQSTARNKVRQFNFNYLKNAYESYSQLARHSLSRSFRTYCQSDLYRPKPNRTFRLLPALSFHGHSILSENKKDEATSESRKVLQNGKNDSSTKAGESASKGKEEEKLSLVKRFKLMYKQYWYVLIPVHLVTSTVWYGSFFFAAKSGIDIVPLLEQLGASESFLTYFRSSDAGYYGIAYAMYKLATPARYTVTIGGTTISINYLVARGYIKPVPTKQELRDMYEVKKEEIKEKRDEMKERYMEKKEEIIEKYHDKTEEIREKKDELLEKYKIKKSSSDEEKRR